MKLHYFMKHALRIFKTAGSRKMILYPAIDLKDGKAVRLLRGDMNKSTVFNDSPVDQALSFVGQNCQWLHLVDLNGAFSGKPINEEIARGGPFVMNTKAEILQAVQDYHNGTFVK